MGRFKPNKSYGYFLEQYILSRAAENKINKMCKMLCIVLPVVSCSNFENNFQENSYIFYIKLPSYLW